MTTMTTSTDDPGVELDTLAHLPHFPHEERLGDAWSDVSAATQPDLRTFRYEAPSGDVGVAVVVDRTDLVDIVLVHRGGTSHHTVRPEEVVAALHLLEARVDSTPYDG